MKKILRYIIIFLLSGGIAGFLVYASLAFGSTEENVENPLKNPTKIIFSQPNIVDGKIENVSLSSSDFMAGKIISAEFGQLSTGFFSVRSDGENIAEKIIRDNKKITAENIRGIFSWYNPFDVYEFFDKNQNFSLKQITSGSMYVSYEDDGTVVLYSVDMVAELGFLSAGIERTKMIVFPGMYVRFDPSINEKIPENADLLRIIQTQQWSDKDTAIVFINPRIELWNNQKDVIVPFILKNSAEKLFDYLKLASKNRIETIDKLKEYWEKSKRNFANNDAIQNPTKRMYRILGELQVIFSEAVNGEIEAEEFRKKIENILVQTEEFKLDNTAKKMIEQFLIDSRFALFMGTSDKNARYQKLYDEAANILGINPTTPKWKMFQVLSNIFSKNILEDKMSVSQMSIDTVNILNSTLLQGQNQIEINDFFDISLYSFLILRTMPDVQDAKKIPSQDTGKMSLGLQVFSEMMFSRAAIEEDSIYKIYATIFDATQNYATRVPDANQKNNAQTVLATDFYSPMLYLLVNSLYQIYTVNENNEIYLATAFENRGIPELSGHNHKKIVENLNATYNNAKKIFDAHIKTSSSISQVSRLEIEKYLAQLKWFIDILNADTYNEYQKTPYIAITGTNFPVYNAKTGILERKATTPVSVVQNTLPVSEDSTEVKNDENIAKISKILSTLIGILPENEQITLTSPNVYLVNFSYQNRKFSFYFNSKNNIISSLKVVGNREMIFSDNFPITTLRLVINSLSSYESQIQAVANDNSPASIHFVNKQAKIGSNTIVLK